ncbi:MAG: transposase [Candidatus Dadabacteria bacterium]|nr:transposase [Candidatus Dadabacteria bacterium]
MPNKPSFSDLAYKNKKKITRKQRFLEKMDEILPWEPLLEPILSGYPKSRRGRRPFSPRIMLRIYLMQQWYGLSDPAMEESLYDVESMRRFAGVSMQRIPDESTICKFRHFLLRHQMTEELLGLTVQCLSEHGLTVSRSRITEPRLRRVRQKVDAGKSTRR